MRSDRGISPESRALSPTTLRRSGLDTGRFQHLLRAYVVELGRQLPDPVENEKSSGTVDADAASRDPAVFERLRDPLIGAFVLLPDPDVVPHVDQLAGPHLFETGQHV